MSIWVNLYCRKTAGRFTPAALTAGIRDHVECFSDLYAGEDPEDALARLQVEAVKSAGAYRLLHLHYLRDGPPIVIDRIGTEVAGYVEEYLEERFRGRKGKAATSVRKHLGETVEGYFSA